MHPTLARGRRHGRQDRTLERHATIHGVPRLSAHSCCLTPARRSTGLVTMAPRRCSLPAALPTREEPSRA
eukprot:scaffold69686_cov59-Phaeocystis_antarctica.AAC.2